MICTILLLLAGWVVILWSVVLWPPRPDPSPLERYLQSGRIPTGRTLEILMEAERAHEGRDG